MSIVLRFVPVANSLRSMLLLAIFGLALCACTESERPEATGKGTVRAIHSVPTAAEVVFLIEERSLGNVSYKNSTAAQQFDDLTYNFNFDARRPGESSPSRIATETVTLVPEMDYVFVLTGTIGSPSVLVWETEERQWEGTETTFEVSVGHLSPSSGPVDVYFVENDAPPVAGSARGALAFGEHLPPFEIENGEYQLVVTEQGEPAAVLFRSRNRDYTERTSVLFTIQDADPSITSPLSVRRIERAGTSVEVGDPSYPPTRRFFNAAFGSGSIDVYEGDNFGMPIVSNLAFGALSADVPVPVGPSDYTYTAAGNPGAILLEDEDTVGANTRGTNFVTGEPDDLSVAVLVDDRRPVTGFGKVRLSQLSAAFEQVDVYVLKSGTDVADASPNLPRLATGNSSGYMHLEPGDYRLTVTKTGEKTVLAGPLAIGVASGDIVETAVLDTADPNLLSIVVYD